MFDTLIELYNGDIARFWSIIISIFIIFSLMVWISIIDIKKKSVTFWKMLIASASTIIMPFFSSFFCGCHVLKWFILASLFLWVFFLFINVKLNNDRFIGKADIDLLSALVSECICVSAWIVYTTESYASFKITQLWYLMFLYLLIGTLGYLLILCILTAIKCIMHKNNEFSHLKGSRLSVIPILLPVAIMIPYNIMTM